MPSRIKKRGENTYLLSVAAGYDGRGRQITYTRTVNASSKREAEKHYALFLAEIENGQTASPGKTTVEQFCSLWLINHAEKHLAPKTIQRYRQLINLWIVPAMGKLQLGRLKPMHLMSFYDNLTEDGIRKDGKSGGLSPRTILHIHRLLHTIMQAAIQWDYLPYNPISKVKAPRADRPDITILDEEQLGHFLLLLDKHDLKWKVLSLLLLAAGIRIGEALGVEWQHIDMDNSIMAVEQASQYLGHNVGTITKRPKNKASERLVALPNSLVELLHQYKSYQAAKRIELGSKWQGGVTFSHDRLFTTWNGRPMFPGSYNTWLSRLCLNNGLPHITPHSLRHLSATLLINANISLKNISARLGHNRTSTTGDIYSHFLKSTDKIAAEKMDAILLAAKEKKQAK